MSQSIRKSLLFSILKYPQRWAKAFSFLKNEDMAALSPGRYELEGSDLFVNIDEYTTNEEATQGFCSFSIRNMLIYSIRFLEKRRLASSLLKYIRDRFYDKA
ncbi:MAG: YhcH/YjgK/YiaL family protein [Draconibacterium sp.]